METPVRPVPASPRASAAARLEDELLRPTLTPDFDVRAFRRPFEPRHLIWSGFLGGPLAGGALVAWNHWRMNRPRASAWVALLTLLLTLACGAAAGWWLHTRGLEQGRLAVRIVQRALGTALVLVLVPGQKQRFDAYRLAGLPPGKVLLPSLVAILGLGTLQGLLGVAVARYLDGGGAP